MDPRSIDERISDRHFEQRGHVPVERIGMKLAEEVGELSGAVVRHQEHRDGRCWREEIEDEVGNVMVVLRILCYRLNIDFNEAENLGIQSFLTREWNVERCD